MPTRSILLFKVELLLLNFMEGFHLFSYSFDAWHKLIFDTQQDFSPVGMSSRDVFFYMLTGG
jgi:hypothetical protein